MRVARRRITHEVQMHLEEELLLQSAAEAQGLTIGIFLRWVGLKEAKKYLRTQKTVMNQKTEKMVNQKKVKVVELV